MSEFVTAKECQLTREGLYKDLARHETTLEEQGRESTDTKVILAKLTLLQEIALRTTSDLAETVKANEKRIIDRQNEEIQEAKDAKVRADQISIVEADRPPKFWETPTGIWAIRVGVGVAVVIVLVALGQNVSEIISGFAGGGE